MADPFVPNHTFVVNDIKRRRGGRVPLATNSTVIGKRPKTEILFLHNLLECFWFVRHDVDADQDEWLVFQLLDERPLVGPMGPSGWSVLLPEID